MFHILTVLYNLNGEFTIGNDNSLNARFLIGNYVDLINTGTFVVGRKTWFSIDSQTREKIKKSIVLTNDTTLHSQSSERVQFTNSINKKDLELKSDYYICGGIDIINHYMKSYDIKNYYFVVLDNYFTPPPTSIPTTTPNNCFIKIPLKNNLVIKGVSQKKFDSGFNVYFRLLILTEGIQNTHYLNYFENYRTLIDNSYSQFGLNCSFDVSLSIPIIGNLNYKTLIENTIDNLKGNTFTDTSNKVPWNWRFLNADYSLAFSNTKGLSRTAIGGIDQIHQLEKNIKEFIKNKDKNFEYTIYSYNPSNKTITQYSQNTSNQLSFQICIPSNSKEMHMNVYLTKCDYTCEFPKLLFEYSLLLHILSAKHNFNPKSISFLIGHCYIEKNMDLSSFKSYIPSPFIQINESVRYKTIDEIEGNDIFILGLQK